VTISPAAGTTVTGPVRDGGDGTYRVTARADAGDEALAPRVS
jgi:hypothetical protein